MGRTIKFNLPENELTVSIHSFRIRKKAYLMIYRVMAAAFISIAEQYTTLGDMMLINNLTGRDKAVVDFLEKEAEVMPFFEQAKQLVEASVKKYQQRNFQHLQVGFGCTGGQHRSVYCAEKNVQVFE